MRVSFTSISWNSFVTPSLYNLTTVQYLFALSQFLCCTLYLFSFFFWNWKKLERQNLPRFQIFLTNHQWHFPWFLELCLPLIFFSPKRPLVSRDLCFCFKKRPLYGFWASFLMKWTEVEPSLQDLPKKIQFQINSWRNKPMDKITRLIASKYGEIYF